jgi:hypothetical protein
MMAYWIIQPKESLFYVDPKLAAAVDTNCILKALFQERQRNFRH